MYTIDLFTTVLYFVGSISLPQFLLSLPENQTSLVFTLIRGSLPWMKWKLSFDDDYYVTIYHSINFLYLQIEF